MRTLVVLLSLAAVVCADPIFEPPGATIYMAGAWSTARPISQGAEINVTGGFHPMTVAPDAGQGFAGLSQMWRFEFFGSSIRMTALYNYRDHHLPVLIFADLDDVFPDFVAIDMKTQGTLPGETDPNHWWVETPDSFILSMDRNYWQGDYMEFEILHAHSDPVPEPTPLALLALVGVAWVVWRRR